MTCTHAQLNSCQTRITRSPHARSLRYLARLAAQGKFIVRHGGAASGFKNRKDSDSYDTDGTELYHVKGSSALDAHAVQVAEKAASLNSGDCFVLLTPKTLFVWEGRHSNAAERATAASVAKHLQGARALTAVAEGAEPDEFWAALGGKGDYAAFREVQPSHLFLEPRLFHCSNASGAFRVAEVFRFSQPDLCQDDVYLLDTGREVFVWVGHNSNAQEREHAAKAALDYVEQAPDGRRADTPVFKVVAGNEPPVFTCHFRVRTFARGCRRVFFFFLCSFVCLFVFFFPTLRRFISSPMSRW